MNCLVRLFSQYCGDPVSLLSQITLSEFQKFDRLPRIGLWFFSIIVFCSSLETWGFADDFLGIRKHISFPKKEYILIAFLGAFAKLLNATISFVMSGRLSVRVKQLSFHWMDFYKI